MAALTADRNTPRREGRRYAHPVAAAMKVYAGSIVVLNAAGDARPGYVALNLIVAGLAQAQVDNSAGAAGDKTIEVESGIFGVASDGTLNRTHIGKTVYLVDDQTVAATDGTGTRSAAGTLKDLEGSGATATAWVQLG